MAIIQCIPTSCKAELLQGVHDFDQDDIKIALYDEDTDLGPDTMVYTTTGEVVGTGYTAGGEELPGSGVQNSSGSAWVDWDNISWPSASFYASGALIYNSTQDNRAVMVLSFGGPRLFNASQNTVTFPDSTPITSLMRLT